MKGHIIKVAASGGALIATIATVALIHQTLFGAANERAGWAQALLSLVAAALSAASIIVAMRTLTASRQATAHDLRAYVGNKGAMYRAVGGSQPDFAFNFSNFGHTPASEVRWMLAFQIAVEPSPPGLWEHMKSVGILDPGQDDHAIISRHFDVADIEANRPHGRKMFVTLRIEYRDFQGVERWRQIVYHTERNFGPDANGAYNMWIWPGSHQGN